MKQLWRRRYGKLLLALPIAFLLFVGASLAAASYTERSSFCVSACHEMSPYGATWKTSVHHDVACVKCHIKPGLVSLVKAKGSALREVYVHLAGEVKAPIAVTEHVPDSTCSQSGCHSRRTTYDRVVLQAAPALAANGAAGAAPSSTATTSASTRLLAAGAASATPVLAVASGAAATTPSSAAASPSAQSSPAVPPSSPAPPVVFSHEQHAKVPLCIDCHDRVVHRTVPGRTYVDPTSMTFCLRCHDGSRAPNACDTCHTPPHGPRGACTDCHTVGTWASSFTHPIALGTQHRDVACEKCHSQSSPQTIGFAAGCVTCHGKHHETVSVVLCAKCHAPTHFAPSTFKHPASGCQACHTPPHPDRGVCTRCHTVASWADRLAHPFPLAGRHTGFACEKCHTKGFDAPGLNCDSCHQPPHSSYGACLKCHTMGSFASRFSHPFRLAGVHTGFVCEKCHTKGITAPGLNCDSCHHRPHPYYGPCLNCHTMTSFASDFSHPIQLAGVHTGFACARCHVNGIGSPGVSCTACHGSNHGGLRNCAQCHTQAGWQPTTFRHGSTGMDGWQRMACSKCHPNNQFGRVACSCHGNKPPSGD
jgi:c(7)-type cytochrome triheme protein